MIVHDNNNKDLGCVQKIGQMLRTYIMRLWEI